MARPDARRAITLHRWCYVAIATAVFETIYTNSVSRRGDKDRALRLDRRCR
jgi:hypothetical protein